MKKSVLRAKLKERKNKVEQTNNDKTKKKPARRRKSND
jgi:hypothetical protein